MEIWQMPYVGVTGFFDEEEVHLLVMRLGEHEDRVDGTLCPGRRLMIGILVSDKTFSGELERRPRRYPPIDWLPRICRVASDSGDALTMRVIHYNTRNKHSFAKQLKDLYTRCGISLSGIQLNVAWPDLRQIETYKNEVPETQRIILQIGAKAMIGNSPTEVAEKVTWYQDLITDILVDPSGGDGIAVKPEIYIDVLKAIQQRTGGEIGLGFAGGLSADSGKLLEDFYRQFPNLSINAEGRIRTPDDRLDHDAAARYVETALAAIHKSRLIKKG